MTRARLDAAMLRTMALARLWRRRSTPPAGGPPPAQLLQQLPHPVLVLDACGRVVSGNAACEALYRRPLATVVGASWLETAGAEPLHGDGRLRGPYPQRLLTGWPGDRDQHYWEWCCGALYRSGGSGVVDYLLLSGLDVTEQYMTLQSLRQDRQRFRDFAETAADWFWETDAELRLSFFSEQHQAIAGVAVDDMRHWTLEQLLNRYSAEQPQGLARLSIDLAERRPFGDFQYAWRRPDGEVRILKISARPRFDDDGRFLGYRGVGSDVTASFQLTQKLAHQATHDALTGLVNRREFEQRLERVIQSAHSHGTQHALFYLDLDKFKQINDSCSHAAGDELLRQLGALLKRHVRGRDTLARLGGDEFAVLIEHSTLETSIRIASALLSAVRQFRFVWQDQTLRVGLSVGLVVIDDATRSAAAVQQAADSACYVAKNLGGNRIYVNHKGNVELDQLRKDQRWATELKRALAEGRFQLDYQPIVPLDERGGDHVELLLRMVDETGKTVRPRVFWPVAERHNLTPQLDRWVVRAALDWLQSDPVARDRLVLCFVNLAPASIKDESFLGYVIEQFDNSGVAPEKICFEITEAATANSLARAVLFIKALKSYGCRFALDNFGHGQFSLAALKKLPVDFLKIDRLFVRHVDGDPVNFAMVKSLNEISRALGKTTIAEFVEDEPTLQKLREIGVDYAQGYHTGRPRALQRASRPLPDPAEPNR